MVNRQSAFALSLPDGRWRFLVGLAVFILAFSLVKQKKGVALWVVAFIALRSAWAGVVLLMSH